MPCLDEAEHIEAAVRTILANDLPRSRRELLVVDGMSNDATRSIVTAIADDNPDVILVDNPRRTTPAALNTGIRAARGEVIVRVDGHTTYPRNYLSGLVRGLIEHRADNVGGVFESRPSSSGPLARAIAMTLNHRLGVGNSTFRTGADEAIEVDTVPFGCWWRDVFDQVGFFNEDLLRNQDLDFNQRLRAAGGKIVLLPDVTAAYSARTGWRQAWRHNRSNGYWVTYGWLAHGARFRPRHIVPLLFVGALGASLLIAPISLIPLGLVVLPYIAVVAVATVVQAERTRDYRASAFLPAAFINLHVSYGIGSVRGLASGITRRISSRHGARREHKVL